MNMTLWDDVMREFMPLTSQDIIIAGTDMTLLLLCALLSPHMDAISLSNLAIPICNSELDGSIQFLTAVAMFSRVLCVAEGAVSMDGIMPEVRSWCRVWGMVPAL